MASPNKKRKTTETEDTKDEDTKLCSQCGVAKVRKGAKVKCNSAWNGYSARCFESGSDVMCCSCWDEFTDDHCVRCPNKLPENARRYTPCTQCKIDWMMRLHNDDEEEDGAKIVLMLPDGSHARVAESKFPFTIDDVINKSNPCSNTITKEPLMEWIERQHCTSRDPVIKGNIKCVLFVKP
jgi:hypothetical protein